MARNVPQIGHDCFLPNLYWLTRCSSHRISKLCNLCRWNSTNWGSITKANHNAHDELPHRATGYGPFVQPWLLTSDFAAKWLKKKLNKEYSLQQYVDKYLKWMAACIEQTARGTTINNRRSSFVIDIPMLHCSLTAAVTSDYVTFPIHYLSAASRFQPSSLALCLAYVN
jgi:hypothetical protein